MKGNHSVLYIDHSKLPLYLLSFRYRFFKIKKNKIIIGVPENVGFWDNSVIIFNNALFNYMFINKKKGKSLLITKIA